MVSYYAVNHVVNQSLNRCFSRHPLAERRASRLLCLDGPTGELVHRGFADLLDYLRPGDLMVFNNTRVIAARLLGRKATGGQLEILVERVLDSRRVASPCAFQQVAQTGQSHCVGG